jgi:hypothetical protein
MSYLCPFRNSWTRSLLSPLIALFQFELCNSISIVKTCHEYISLLMTTTSTVMADIRGERRDRVQELRNGHKYDI